MADKKVKEVKEEKVAKIIDSHDPKIDINNKVKDSHGESK